MTNPTYFTVVADFKSVVVDLASDVDPDPQLGPVTAKVTFTPVLGNGDVILATNASPRPTVFVPAPIVARIDTDGRLKLRVAPDGDRDDYANLAAFPATGNTAKVYFAIDTQTFYRWIAASSQYVADYSYAQVRLLADTGLLELDSPLYYKVTFSEVVFNGGPGYINSFTFQAPTSDTELNLVEVMRQPGQPAVGITKIAPGAVRAEDGNLIFSFNGVDIPEPVPYTDVDVTLDAADISDGTPTGRALITAASVPAARAVLGPGGVDFIGTPTAIKTAAYTASVGDIVRADATAGGFTISLPSAPAAGSTIVVKKVDATRNTVLVQRTGNDTFNTATTGPSWLQLSLPGQSVHLRYVSGVWTVLTDSFAPAAINDYYDSVRASLTNKTLLDARFDQLDDVNGNPVVSANPTANATAHIQITNAAFPNSPTIRALSSIGAGVNLQLRATNGNVAALATGGQPAFVFNSQASPVNYLESTATATGAAAKIAAKSFTDTNVSLNLEGQGTGVVQAGGVPVVTTTGTQTLTNKTITSGTLVTPALGTPSSGTLTNCTFPTLNQNTTGTASNVTGTVAVANGGTGTTTLTANNVVLGNGTSAVQVVAPGSSGNVLTSNGTTWTSAAPTNATGLPPNPSSNRYLAPPSGVRNTWGTGTSQIRGRKIVIPKDLTVNQIGCSVQSAGASGALVRLGIYNSDANGYPSTLVVHAGTVDVTSTGTKTITISQALTAGTYWLVAAGDVIGCTLHSDSATGNTLYSTSIETASADGVLSSTWTAGTAFPSTFTTSGLTTNVPFLALRVA
jgi:hypothetical protein